MAFETESSDCRTALATAGSAAQVSAQVSGETQRTASQHGSIAGLGAPEVALPLLSVHRLQIGELGFPDYAGVALHLALDLVRQLAAGFRELTDDDEGLAPIGDLADLGAKPHLLPDGEFMRLHGQSSEESIGQRRRPRYRGSCQHL